MGSLDWRQVAMIAAAIGAWVLPAVIVSAAVLARSARDRRDAYQEGCEAGAAKAIASDEELAGAYRAGLADGRGERETAVVSPVIDGAIRLPKDPQAAHDVLLALALHFVDWAEEIAPAPTGNGDAG